MKSDKHAFIPWNKRQITMALMTPPVTFLLCDKNRLFRAKQIAGLQDLRKLTERKREISQLADSFEISCSLRRKNVNPVVDVREREGMRLPPMFERIITICLKTIEVLPLT